MIRRVKKLCGVVHFPMLLFGSGCMFPISRYCQEMAEMVREPFLGGIKDSCEKVNGVMLRDEDGNGHMAFVSDYSKGKLKFTGYSILKKKGGYDGGTLQANGSKQNGWTIVGVMLK